MLFRVIGNGISEMYYNIVDASSEYKFQKHSAKSEGISRHQYKENHKPSDKEQEELKEKIKEAKKYNRAYTRELIFGQNYHSECEKEGHRFDSKEVTTKPSIVTEKVLRIDSNAIEVVDLDLIESRIKDIPNKIKSMLTNNCSIDSLFIDYIEKTFNDTINSKEFTFNSEDTVESVGLETVINSIYSNKLFFANIPSEFKKFVHMLKHVISDKGSKYSIQDVRRQMISDYCNIIIESFDGKSDVLFEIANVADYPSLKEVVNTVKSKVVKNMKSTDDDLTVEQRLLKELSAKKLSKILETIPGSKDASVYSDLIIDGSNPILKRALMCTIQKTYTYGNGNKKQVVDDMVPYVSNILSNKVDRIMKGYIESNLRYAIYDAHIIKLHSKDELDKNNISSIVNKIFESGIFNGVPLEHSGFVTLTKELLTDMVTGVDDKFISKYIDQCNKDYIRLISSTTCPIDIVSLYYNLTNEQSFNVFSAFGSFASLHLLNDDTKSLLAKFKDPKVIKDIISAFNLPEYVVEPLSTLFIDNPIFGNLFVNICKRSASIVTGSTVEDILKEAISEAAQTKTDNTNTNKEKGEKKDENNGKDNDRQNKTDNKSIQKVNVKNETKPVDIVRDDKREVVKYNKSNEEVDVPTKENIDFNKDNVPFVNNKKKKDKSKRVSKHQKTKDLMMRDLSRDMDNINVNVEKLKENMTDSLKESNTYSFIEINDDEIVKLP